MSKTYKAGQHIYRVLPCPSYEISCLENWMSDMAEAGFHLVKDGIFAGIATFEYREPEKVKYRLEATEKNTSMWSDDGGEPDPEQVELSRQYSWEYVAKLKDFYIYRSADTSARELNTDPEVQALALNAVKKRQRDAIVSSLILLVLYPIILTKGCLLLTTISMGTWWMAFMLLFAVLLIADEIRAFCHLKRVQRKLMDEGNYSSETDWKKSMAPYYCRKIVKTVLAIVLICAFLRAWGVSITNENKILLAEYSGTIPFATMRDFAGEGSKGYEETMTGLSMGFNTIEEKADLLAPRCIEFNEHARVQKADGSYIDGGLDVDYCEMRTQGLAHLLIQEMRRMDKMKKGFQLIDAPTLDADEVIAYMNDLHWPTVIIRKGNVVAKAYFYQFSSAYTMTIEEWAGMICDSLGD